MKKLVLMFIAATAALSFPAQAGMQDALNSMFQSNVTSPGAYASATRGGFVGGGIAMRTPIKPINLVAFDPPRFSAGCGGIDMYGGSFTFINKNQFTALLRQIMNNAIGLLFQAALQNISPSMSSLLDSFQQKLQQLNSLASNTCAIANQAIDAIAPGALSTKAKEATARIGSETGSITDHFAGRSPDSDAQSQADNRATEDKNPSAGNFTWRALHRTQVGDMIGATGMAADPADPTGNKPRAFMMSLLGTAISTGFGTETNPANSTQPSYDKAYGKLFGLMDLIAADSIEVYSCGGQAVGGDADSWGPHSCVDLAKAPIDYSGTFYYVRNMLYGDSTQTTSAGIKNAVNSNSPSSPGPHSIYGKIIACQTTNCTFTPAEQAFLQMAGPVFNLLKDAQLDKESVAQISQYIESPLVLMMAEKIGEAAVRAARGAWNGVADVTMPPEVSKRIGELEAEIGLLRQQTNTLKDDLTKARIVADEVRKNIPNIGVN